MTKRPQNVCKNCGYTWYPRGKSVSLKCPKCGSGKVSISGGGLLAGIIVVVGAAALFGGHSKPPTEASNATPSVLEAPPPENASKPTLPPEPPAQPPISTEEHAPPPQGVPQVFTRTTATHQDKEEEKAGEPQTPSATCRKDEGNFISWNNCMWRECARSEFRDLDECRSKRRD
ncbi:hypothetical protein CJO92_17070 (plasmid) [Ralstonia solanacearum]|uniref:Transmembrane protein n=1 Tax=Ralstonia solanacearum TaxID=305 RepID=A0AAD0WHP5_RALSL|nr:hypothetical protein CJO77_17065 [Ralstonia solanacearum]AXW54465.1 hypothetical protein CJO92_17070 [Ralstonia solanacearum]